MQFEAALCHMDRLYERFRDNRLAWAELLEQTCRAPRSKRKFKDTAKCLVELVLTFIGIMDGEGDVERMFSRLQLVEVNRRKRHHKEETLMDIMKIGADGPGFELESMVTLAPEPLPGSDPQYDPLTYPHPHPHPWTTTPTSNSTLAPEAFSTTKLTASPST